MSTPDSFGPFRENLDQKEKDRITHFGQGPQELGGEFNTLGQQAEQTEIQTLAEGYQHLTVEQLKALALNPETQKNPDLLKAVQHLLDEKVPQSVRDETSRQIRLANDPNNRG